MLREELAKLYGSRRRFQGVVDRFGKKAGWKYPLTTVMLKDVSDCTTQTPVTDHLWFILHKRFASLNLSIGDVVSFDARVTKYLKGYQGRRDENFGEHPPGELDYRLSFPTKLMVAQRVHQSIDDSTQIKTLNEPSTVEQSQLTKWFLRDKKF